MSGNIQNRRNWTGSLTIVIVIASIGALIGCFANLNDKKKVDRAYFQNSAGAVLFDHAKHKSLSDSCITCHHDLYGAAQAASCTDCHDDDYLASDFDHTELKEYHINDCSKCHKQTHDDKYAASCRQCHPAAQSENSVTKTCAGCHDDSYLPDMMEHDEYTEVTAHTCIGCHSPQSVSEAYHTNCSNCHLKTLPDRFSTNDGDVSCGACHLR